jgi:hypothetical protein
MNLDTNECRLWSEVFSTEDLTEEISLAQPSDTSMIYFHGTVGFNDAPINCDFAGREYGTCKTFHNDIYYHTVSFITPPVPLFLKLRLQNRFA